MKKIGKGWQYTVYQIDEHRVLKKRNTKFQAYMVMLASCFPYIKNHIWGFPYFYDAGTHEARTSLEKIMTSSIDKKFFGNPAIIPNTMDYEQDYVESIEGYLKHVDEQEGKFVIDKFVEFNKILLKNRLIDKSFAIGKNFGINEQGEIIMIDIGEIWSNENNIKKQIDKKAWTAHYVLDPIPKNLRTYFCRAMDVLTLENE